MEGFGRDSSTPKRAVAVLFILGVVMSRISCGAVPQLHYSNSSMVFQAPVIDSHERTSGTLKPPSGYS